MGEYGTTVLADELDIYAVEGDLAQFAFDRLYDDVETDVATGITVGVDTDDGIVERFAYVTILDDAPGPQCAYAYAAERTEDGYAVTRFTDGSRHPATRLAGAHDLFMVEGQADIPPVPAADDPIAVAEHVYDAASRLHDNRYLAETVLDDIAGTRLGNLGPGKLEFLTTLTSRLDLNATGRQPDADTVITEEKLEPIVDGLHEEEVDIPFATFLHTDVVERRRLLGEAPDGINIPDVDAG